METCIAIGLRPPENSTITEMEKAQTRLIELGVEWQFDLSRHLCSVAHTDLRWLSTQPVLGAGSFVMLDTEDKRAATLKRPEVWHNYDMATMSLGRELAYLTTSGTVVQASSIVDVLVRTNWPMGQMPEADFSYDGPLEVWYLPGPEKNKLAEKWGIVWHDRTPGTCSS